MGMVKLSDKKDQTFFVSSVAFLASTNNRYRITWKGSICKTSISVIKRAVTSLLDKKGNFKNTRPDMEKN